MSNPPYPGGYPPDPGSPQGYPQYPQPPQPSQPGYPSPAQPPYAQPPYYPQAPVYPPPARRNAGRVGLIIGVVAAVLLVACIGLCASLVVGAGLLGKPLGTAVSQLATQGATVIATTEVATTVSEFCTAESSQDYTTAYSYLSPSLQQTYSESRFTLDNQRYDSTLGTVTDCNIQGSPTLSGETASVVVAVTRTLTPTPGTPGTASATGQISLVMTSSGSWEVSGIAASLNML